MTKKKTLFNYNTMDYKQSFQKRSQSYLQAIKDFPEALENEFLNAIKMLQLKENDVVLNIPAGGIPLEKYIDVHVNYFAFDTHDEFTSNEIKYCTWDNIPLKNKSVDKIICLASLHHLNTNERISTLKEFHRILKKTGKLVIGDIINKSPQAIWLNDFVNTYNSDGHKGIFFTPEDSLFLNSQGFNVSTTIVSYPWVFNSNTNAIIFCKLLFGLDLLDLTDPKLSQGVKDILNLENGKIPWQLIYFVCSPQ